MTNAEIKEVEDWLSLERRRALKYRKELKFDVARQIEYRSSLLTKLLTSERHRIEVDALTRRQQNAG